MPSSVRTVSVREENATLADEKPQPNKYDSKSIFKEVASFSLPMLATLAADPLAALVDTAYVGHLGTVPLAGVGMAVSIFNSITKVLNGPLLAVTTSTVAVANGMRGATPGTVATAASSAIILALVFGLAQAIIMGIGAPILVRLWGASDSSPVRKPALQFLLLRGFSAPITVLMLVLQGIYRGLLDTTTPFYATLFSTALNIGLEPVFIFVLKLNVRGSALATLVAQAIPTICMLLHINSRHPLKLRPRNIKLNELMKLFGPTGCLVLRTSAIIAVYAVATSIVVRLGPLQTATHQVCFQLWMACGLLVDSLAAAAQTILAKSIAGGELRYARKVVRHILLMAFVLGFTLSAVLFGGKSVFPKFFTNDKEVLKEMTVVLPFVVLTQPINAVAFVWDGILYGAGGFRFAAWIMAVCAFPAVGAMFLGQRLRSSKDDKLIWVWIGLTVVMLLRGMTIWVPYELKMYPFNKMFDKSKQLDGVAESYVSEAENDLREALLNETPRAKAQHVLNDMLDVKGENKGERLV